MPKNLFARRGLHIRINLAHQPFAPIPHSGWPCEGRRMGNDEPVIFRATLLNRNLSNPRYRYQASSYPGVPLYACLCHPLAHNHQCRILQASVNNKAATFKIRKALLLIQVQFFDHLIISADGLFRCGTGRRFETIVFDPSKLALLFPTKLQLSQDTYSKNRDRKMNIQKVH